MIRNQNSKVIMGLLGCIAILGIGAVALRKYLSYQDIENQSVMVQKSAKALKSFQDHYFQCNELSKKTLEKFVNNHELKIRRLMLLKNENYIQLEQELDILKQNAQEKLESCEPK